MKKPVGGGKKPQGACALDMETHPAIRMPRYTCPEEHQDIMLIHLRNRFRAAPDSVALDSVHFNRFCVEGRPIRS